MTKNDLVSIVMPVKNTSKFLDITINSILSQTYSNWELLAVNDYSSDNSLEILQKYAVKDSRIKVFNNQRDYGIIPALRIAFLQSRGSMITRMDSDDIMEIWKLEKMVDLLKKVKDGHVITGPVKCFSKTPLGDGYKKYENWLNSLILTENCYDEIYKECVIQSSCWLIYRDDFVKAGAFNHDTYPEDYDLCFRFYKNNLKVKSCKSNLHQWRDHPARTSRNDSRYEDQQYFDLKLKYFFEIEYDQDKTIIVWGAGKKGKKLVRKLQAMKNGLKFIWVSNNGKKIGEKIYGIEVNDATLIKTISNSQIIVTISAPVDLEQLKVYFDNSEKVQNEDFYFFC